MSTLTREEKRVLIAKHCGKPVFRFCGDLDTDGHEPYTDHAALKHLPSHLQGVDTFVRCRKCDGHRWGSTRVWEQHGDAREYPDYFTDLNAAHEMEKALTVFQTDLFADILVDMLNPSLINGDRPEDCGAPYLAWPGVFTVAHAPAEQRAECFGLAVGLWTA